MTKENTSDTYSLSLSDIINCMSEKSNDKNQNHKYYYTSSCCDTSTECCDTSSKSCKTETCETDTCDTKTECCDTSSKSCDTSSKCCETSSKCCETSSKCCETSSKSCDDTKTCNDCNSCKSKCCCVSTKKTCKELCKNYKKYKDCIVSNNEAIVVLEFIHNKMKDALPVILTREMRKYSIRENIEFIEKFFDGVLCVSTSNNICKKINVKTCKIKNDCEKIDNRVYELKIKYQSCVASKEFTYVFPWSRLTSNNDVSFNAVVLVVIAQLSKDIIQLKAQNTGVFFA